MKRLGFGIGLHRPKNPINVGAAVRSADCYGASMVAYSGRRVRRQDLVADARKAHLSLPLLNCADLHDLIPYGHVPVAVDLLPNAQALPSYNHPPQAFYVFGPEDGTLPAEIVRWCPHRVYIPTNGCLNLSVAVATVLYDRIAKELVGRSNHRPLARLARADQINAPTRRHQA